MGADSRDPKDVRLPKEGWKAFQQTQFAKLTNAVISRPLPYHSVFACKELAAELLWSDQPVSPDPLKYFDVARGDLPPRTPVNREDWLRVESRGMGDDLILSDATHTAKSF